METRTHLKQIRERRNISACRPRETRRRHPADRSMRLKRAIMFPTPTVALQLAQILEVRVEELFCLETDSWPRPSRCLSISSLPAYRRPARATLPRRQPDDRSLRRAAAHVVSRADAIATDSGKRRPFQGEPRIRNAC